MLCLKAIRGRTCSRIAVVNILVFLLNLILYVCNNSYSNINAQFRVADYATPNCSASNITNQAVMPECKYNWSALEATVFASPMDSKESQLLDRMFRTLVHTFEAANLTYFIMGGALLGSLRHHGPIPWDDDTSVIVKASDEDVLIKVLSKLGPDFKLYAMQPTSKRYWKLFPSRGRQLRSGFEYRTPFIDIFLYLENETHVWTATPYWQNQDIWLKRHVFPLQRRPYGELILPAPCNSLAVVGSFADASVCKSRYYSRLMEEEIGDVITTSCDNLAHIYPFVKRSSEKNESSHLVKETLMLGDVAIREVMLEPFC